MTIARYSSACHSGTTFESAVTIPCAPGFQAFINETFISLKDINRQTGRGLHDRLNAIHISTRIFDGYDIRMRG